MKIFDSFFKNAFFLAFVLIFATSCADIDDRDFADERYLTASHFAANSAAGGIEGLKALDGAILSYIRDGGAGTDQFGLMAVDLGMDLRSNDMDMSASTWFGAYHRYTNTVVTSGNNDFIWTFFYRIINNANSIINSIPDDSPDEVLVYKYKSQTYRAIAYFYLLRIYQHTKASDSELAVPIDLGTFVPQGKSTVGQVKAYILADLNAAYAGLENYSRATKEEVDGSVVAAYLARYHLTYENWADAETYADIAMNGGTIETDVQHGFDELSLSEALWGAVVTDATSEVYASFFSHTSQINDGYSGWNHTKSINSNLYDAIPSTDLRLKWFADQLYPAFVEIVPGTWEHYSSTPKYTSLKFIAQPGPGYFIGDYIYLRNAEFYLTKAEAIARQGGRDSEAQQVLFDLNSLRDPSYSLSANTGQALIDEILLYRRLECWGEGVASFDMARLGIGLNRQDGRLNRVQPGGDLVIPALDPKMIFPIPIAESDANPNF